MSWSYCVSTFYWFLIKQTILIYCVTCRKKTKNLDLKVFETKSDRIIMQSKCAAYGIKKSRFVKEQKAKWLLTNLGIKTPLSKTSLLNVLFWVYKNEWIVNKFLLTGDKFMPEMHLKQPAITYSTCGPFTKIGNADRKYRFYLQKWSW